MPGSPSNAPSRTETMRGSAWLRLQSCEPHSAQNAFAKPPSAGRYSRIRASPCATCSDPSSTRACAEAGVPVRRRQRVQWHQPALTSGRSISKRTPPQRQPPVSGSSGSGGDEDVLEVFPRPPSRTPVDVAPVAPFEVQARAREDLGVELAEVVDDDEERPRGDRCGTLEDGRDAV